MPSHIFFLIWFMGFCCGGAAVIGCGLISAIARSQPGPVKEKHREN
jgi:hypothetical protein